VNRREFLGLTLLSHCHLDKGKDVPLILPFVIPPPPPSFDVFVSPTGDDAIGTGTINSPWSATIFVNNPSAVAQKRVGFLPGLYQGGTSGGNFTSFYSRSQANLPPIPVPAGISGFPTFLGSSDANGNYLRGQAIIDCSDPNTVCSFTGSISANTLTVTAISSGTLSFGQFINIPGGIPTWINRQATGTTGGIGTYTVGPQAQTVASGPLTALNTPFLETNCFEYITNGTNGLGFITIAGFWVRHFGINAIHMETTGGADAVDFNIYDNELGPCRGCRGDNNPGVIKLRFIERANIYNNKIHDCGTQVPVNINLASAPASGSTVSTLTLAAPWPWPAYPVSAGQHFPMALSTGQTFFGVVTTLGGTTISIVSINNGNPTTLTVTGTPTTVLTVQPSGFAPYGLWSYIQVPAGTATNSTTFDSINFYNNTSYGCGSAWTKDLQNNVMNCHHNYIELGVFGTASTGSLNGLTTGAPNMVINGAASNQIAKFHHNIVIGTCNNFNLSGFGVCNKGLQQFYNNTFHNCQFTPLTSNSTSPGVTQWYNNIMWFDAPPSGIRLSMDGLDVNNWGGAGTFIDFNWYMSPMQFGEGHFAASGTPASFTQWQTPGFWATPAGFPGFDLHSTYTTTSPFAGTPSSNNVSSFIIAGSATTAGQNGAAVGALDGSGTVGCNF